jgi:hypothetical protein
VIVVSDVEEHWAGSDMDSSPTVEVRVFRHGALVHRELCESEAEAATIADWWSELEGVTVEVDDLTVSHRPGDILEPELALLDDDVE